VQVSAREQARRFLDGVCYYLPDRLSEGAKGDAVTIDELQDALRRFGGELATAMSAAADAARTNNPAKMMGALRQAEAAADDLVRRM
jgi:hypothetical protein